MDDDELIFGSCISYVVNACYIARGVGMQRRF